MIMDTASAGGERTRFELIERLGKGGAGCVWRARLWGRHGITRIVALKVVEAGDEAVLRRMRDEARLLGLLQHRALVQVQDLVELEGGRWGMVMELLEGVDLQGLTAMGPVPFGVLLDVVAEVADALDCALKARDLEGRPLALTHRDVKPANLLMCADGRIKLLDFGVARANISTRESVTLQGELWGTLGYMSPERLHGEDTPAVDIYALGVVLYELALRQRFGRASLVLDEHEDRLTEARRRLELAQAPQGFIELTMSMLDYYPDARPDAGAVRDRARALRAATPEPALSVWAGRVVPYARQTRLARLGPNGPVIALWTVTPPPFAALPPSSAPVPPSAAPVPTLPSGPPAITQTVPMERSALGSLVGDGLARPVPVTLALAVLIVAAFHLSLATWAARSGEEPAAPRPVASIVQAEVDTGPPAVAELARAQASEAPSASSVLAAPAPPSSGSALQGARPVRRTVERGATSAPEASPAVATVSAPQGVIPPPTSVILNLAPEPDRMGVVRISGDVVEALARSSAGEWRLPGAVPVGTYTIMARFDGGPVELAGVLRVSADKTTTVRCVPETRSCTPARE